MNNTETNVIIFTDGSSRGNPGPGGWGVVVVESRKLKVQSNEPYVTELGGGEKYTTNNRMELTAAVEGISHTPKGSHIQVMTDSKYVINGITSWINGWKNNGWITKTKDDVVNKDLWMRLDSCVADKKIEWKYVGGHIGILGNERCDHIATDFADGRDYKLYKGKLSQYDLPDILNISYDQENLNKKKSSSNRSKTKAYSYISIVDGNIEKHKTWTECEIRVKGVRGARYKKSISKEDEVNIVDSFME